MSQVKWGMFIESYKRTAFERQLEEAVTIERVARENVNILNSKSEWASSALPRLVTRYGKLEDEMKEYEKELKHEKSREEEFERKLREMRKVKKQAEAEVVPSSSLVEVEVVVEVGLGVEVEIEVGVEVGVEVEVGRCSLDGLM